MKKIGIFFGSSTGYTADVADSIARALDLKLSDIHDVASTAPSAVGDYDVLLLGTSTWGVGDLQDDWYDFLDGLEVLDLKGKQVAIFGCGDQTMSDSFCGAMGEIYKRLQKTGAEFIAPFNADGYEFTSSEAFIDGQMVGLALDQMNAPELTDGRIQAWTALVKESIAGKTGV